METLTLQQIEQMSATAAREAIDQAGELGYGDNYTSRNAYLDNLLDTLEAAGVDAHNLDVAIATFEATFQCRG